MHTFATLTKGVSRVRVTDETSPLVGECGTFLRRVSQSSEAWFRMDNELPAVLQSDFKNEERKEHEAVLFPDGCEVI